MTKTSLLFLFFISLLAISIKSQARRVRNTSYYSYKIIDLPNTAEYLLKNANSQNPAQFMDLAVVTLEYGLNKTVPMWVKEPPKLVGYNSVLNLQYDLKEEEIDKIIYDNHLNKEELLHLNFYRRHGEYFAFGLIIVIGLYGYWPSRKSRNQVQKQIV